MTQPPSEPASPDDPGRDDDAPRARAEFVFPDIKARDAGPGPDEEPKAPEPEERPAGVRYGYEDRLGGVEEKEKKGLLDPFTRPAAFSGLLAALAVTTGFAIWFLTREPGAMTLAEETAAARFDIYLVGQEVEAHRISTGSLPASLSEIGLDDDEVTYATNGETYSLSTMVGEDVVLFREEDELTDYAGDEL